MHSPGILEKSSGGVKEKIRLHLSTDYDSSITWRTDRTYGTADLIWFAGHEALAIKAIPEIECWPLWQ